MSGVMVEFDERSLFPDARNLAGMAETAARRQVLADDHPLACECEVCR